MRHPRSFADRRLSAACAHCGTGRGTLDHVPPKVFLDPPYPEDLPTVRACAKCNGGASLDEEYAACLLECVIAGSAAPEDIRRAKVAGILRRKLQLASRLARARYESDGSVRFKVERERIERVVVKLARGHTYFELSEPQTDTPLSLTVIPLQSLQDHVRPEFVDGAPVGQRNSDHGGMFVPWPEVGSRAMQRLFAGSREWIVVQPGNYRYSVSLVGGVRVRMVVREYLACEVLWE